MSSSSFTIGTKYIIDIINKLNNKTIHIIASNSTKYENDIRKQIKDKCINTINKYNPIIVEQAKQDESIIDYYDKLNNIMIDKIEEIINNK